MRRTAGVVGGARSARRTLFAWLARLFLGGRCFLAMGQLQRQASQLVAGPLQMVAFMAESLGAGLSHRLAQRTVVNLSSQIGEHVPVPVILGLRQHQVFQIVEVALLVGFGAQQAVGFLLRQMGFFALIVDIDARGFHHLLAQLDVATGLFIEPFEPVAQFLVIQFVNSALIEFFGATLGRQHLGEEVFEPLQVQRLPLRPAAQRKALGPVVGAATNSGDAGSFYCLLHGGLLLWLRENLNPESGFSRFHYYTESGMLRMTQSSAVAEKL